MKKQFQFQKNQSRDFLLKSFRKIGFTLLSVALFPCILFTSFSSVHALSPEANGDNPLEIVIEPSESNEKNSSQELAAPNSQNQTTPYPDLGDDQVFPFAAGLDSY